jgi:hypothetical protein
MTLFRPLLKNLPFTYFFGIWSAIGLSSLISGDLVGLIPILIGSSFIGITFSNKKSINLLIGILMFFWSILILFAYLSDASKPGSTNLEAWRFLIFGGLISVLNFLMSYLIVKNSINKSSFTTDRLNATAI